MTSFRYVEQILHDSIEISLEKDLDKVEMEIVKEKLKELEDEIKKTKY